MISAKRLYKITIAWTSIVYTVCFAGVAFFHWSRMMFMRYAMHSDFGSMQSLITFFENKVGFVANEVVENGKRLGFGI